MLGNIPQMWKVCYGPWGTFPEPEECVLSVGECVLGVGETFPEPEECVLSIEECVLGVGECVLIVE